jgi:MFS transporter, SET family, sugar efflux transporter
MAVPAPAQAEAGAGSLLRSLAPLGFVVTLVGLVTSFVSPFLPLFLSTDLHASPGQTSLYLFLMPLAAVAVAAGVGRVSDRPGLRGRVLVVGAVTGFVGFLVFALARGYWSSLIVALSLIAVAGSLMPQVFAFSRVRLDRTHPARAAMAISVLRSLLSLAWVAGPPLAAYLIGLVDFRGLFLVAAVMHLAALPILITSARTEPPSVVPRVREIARSKATVSLLRPGAAFVLLQCAGSLGVMAMPLFVSVDLHRDVATAGLVLGLCAAVEIPLMLLFGLLAARRSLRILLLVGSGFGIAYFVTMAITGSVWQVAVAQVLNASFIAAIGGLGISYFQDLMPERPGHATTTFTNTYRIGAMLAGLLFGLVQVLGYRFSYAIGAVLGAAGLWLLLTTRPGNAALAPGVEQPD